MCSSLRGAGNSTLVSWRVIFSLCAFLCKPSALWRLHCQIPHGSSAFRTVWPSNTHVFASSSRVSPAQTAISPDPAEYFRFKRACLPDLRPALCCLAVCSGSSQWLLESRSDTKCSKTYGCLLALRWSFSPFSRTHTHAQKQTQRKGKLHLDDTVIRQPLCSLPVTHISLHQWKSSTS